MINIVAKYWVILASKDHVKAGIVQGILISSQMLQHHYA
jgi:hypothetical protein